MDAAAVMAALRTLADPERARATAPYLGIAPGGYGDGDRLLGIPVPAQRGVARAARDLALTEAAELLVSPFHEHRFVAVVVLVERHRRAGTPADERAMLSRFYLEHRAGVDNWDLVDASAPHLIGGEPVAAGRAVMDDLAGSPRLWDRRIAMVATLGHLRRGDTAATYALAARLLDDPHHLMHKATGWMLREAGKLDEAELVAWLEAHRARMPRTALRYGIERLAPDLRAGLMAR